MVSRWASECYPWQDWYQPWWKVRMSGAGPEAWSPLLDATANATNCTMSQWGKAWRWYNSVVHFCLKYVTLLILPDIVKAVWVQRTYFAYSATFGDQPMKMNCGGNRWRNQRSILFRQVCRQYTGSDEVECLVGQDGPELGNSNQGMRETSDVSSHCSTTRPQRKPRANCAQFVILYSTLSSKLIEAMKPFSLSWKNVLTDVWC